MTCHGAHLFEPANELKRVYGVSEVQLSAAGQASKVLWGEINAKSNQWLCVLVVAPVAEMIDALHGGDRVLAFFPDQAVAEPEGRFVVFEHDDGHESIALDGPALAGREVQQLARLER